MPHKFFFEEKVSKDEKEMEVESGQKNQSNGGRIQSKELEFAIAQIFKQAAKFAPDDKTSV